MTALITATPIPVGDWLVVAPVLLPIITGALLLMLPYRLRLHSVLALAGLAAVIAADLMLVVRILQSGPVVMTMGSWPPPFGISFAADLLGGLFSLVASGVALICGAYAARDIGPTGRRNGFYPFLLLMMAGINGAFLTGDIFNLYVWFEVLLIASFGLLVLGSERSQIAGATKYALLNLVATTLFLITTGLLYGTFGTLNMADVARLAASQRQEVPLMTLSALFFLAFGMKAAAFPLNFWLPASYHTPRISIAALFGALLTKVGIYALLRILVMLLAAERAAFAGLIGWIAAASMLLGVIGALAQADLRRLIGFLVISGVGVMLSGIALGSALAVSGSIVYAVHSMLAIAALYIVAGAMRESGGSFSIASLSGLYRDRPLLAALALFVGLSIAGLPPGSGLWPKVMLVKSALAAGSGWLAAAVLVSGLLTTIAIGRVFALAFWRETDARPAEPVPLLTYAVLVALTTPMLAIGVYPEPLIRLADRAAVGLLDPAAYQGAVFGMAGVP